MSSTPEREERRASPVLPPLKCLSEQETGTVESGGLFDVLLLVRVDAGVAGIAAEGADWSQAAGDLFGDAAAAGAADVRASANRTLVGAD